MSVNDQMQSGMAVEATRLTQQGRLDEATAAIQRALGGTFIPAKEPGSSGGADEPIDVTSRIVEETPQGPSAVGGARPVVSPTRPRRSTPPPNLLTRGVGRTSGMTVGRAASASVPEGARFLEGSYTNGAGTRSYKLYVPSGYTGQAVPLIVMLHGCTQNPDDFATGTRMNELRRGAHLPRRLPRAIRQRQHAKSAGTGSRPQTSNAPGASRRIIAGITQQVMDEYRVAEGRVYVAGMSAGGAMAAILGATYPDLYAAVGVHSGPRSWLRPRPLVRLYGDAPGAGRSLHVPKTPAREVDPTHHNLPR